jgi:hypothetical protein
MSKIMNIICIRIDKSSGQFLGLIVMSHWLADVWIQIQNDSVVLTFSFRKSCLLVSWCIGGMCGMTCSDEDRGRSRRSGAEDRRWSYRPGTRWPGDRDVEWRCVRSASCMWKRGARVSWLSLKTKVYGLSLVWHQNHWDRFLRFGLKTGGDGFLVESQNQSGWGFFSLGIKSDSYGLVI